MIRLLGAEYETQSGNTLDLNFSTAGGTRARFDSGETTDIVVLPAPMIAELDKAGRFLPDSVVDLGRTVTGVAVKQGAPAPDISTPDAFKQVLLKARSVSFTDPAGGGSSGRNFVTVLQKLGIAEQIFGKAVFGKRGHDVAHALADGRAEIGTTFISEMLTVKGVTVVGPLPGDLHFTNTYTAAIPREGSQAEAARALLSVLTAPATRPRWTAAGLEPAFPTV
jgi:molybdate transport system substrate-binding protein